MLQAVYPHFFLYVKQCYGEPGEATLNISLHLFILNHH